MALGDQTDPYLVKQNDTRPKIRWQPKQGAPPAVIPMTGATAVFNMRSVTVNAQGVVTVGSVVISRGSATVADATNGIVEYTPSSTSWSANIGLHQAEFEVTFSDGGVLTFPPGDKYIWILIGDDIA
jgi:hypothetical protein